MRAVGAQDQLQRRECSPKQIYDHLLPARMKVHIDFVDQEHARSQSSRLFAEVGIQDGAASSDVGDESDHVPHAIA
jgi:hypothetical protein